MGNRGRIGLFGIGLDTYWPQFKGLKERLLGYQGSIAERLSSMGVEVVDAGLVDTPDKSHSAASLFNERQVDAIFLYVSTYALSHTVLPVAQRTKVPLIVLNLQPVSSLNYAEFNALGDRGVMTGEWLAPCQAMGQKGLVGINSTLTTPDSSSFTLVIICISAKLMPVSGSWTLPTSSRTLSSSSVKLFTLAFE